MAGSGLELGFPISAEQMGVIRGPRGKSSQAGGGTACSQPQILQQSPSVHSGVMGVLVKASPLPLVTMVLEPPACARSLTKIPPKHSHQKQVGCQDHKLRSPPPALKLGSSRQRTRLGQQGGGWKDPTVPPRSSWHRWGSPKPSATPASRALAAAPATCQVPTPTLGKLPWTGLDEGRAEPRASKLLHGTDEVWVGAPRQPELAGGARSHPHALSQPATAALQFTGG